MQTDSELDPKLVDINPQDFQDDVDKVDFFGVYAQPDFKTRLKKSSNKEKVVELLRALKNSSCWESAIMKDPHLPYYAMAAYLDNKITRDQLTHIEEFYELKLTYPSAYTAPLLTPSGQFTILVQHILNRMMSRRNTKLPGITSDHIEKFRQSLLEFRKTHGDSALVFHLLPQDDRHHAFTGIASLVGAVFESDVGTVIFPILVRSRFLQSIAPKNSTKAKSVGKLGPVSIDGIEEKQRQFERVSATTHPGGYRGSNVHEYILPHSGATLHDIEHLGASDYFPNRLYLAVLLAVDVIRKKTGIKWSQQTWKLIDGYFIDSQAVTLNDDINTVYKVDEELSEQKANKWFKNVLYNSELTLYIVLEDMQNNPAKWQPFIDVKKFFEQTVEKAEKDKLKVKTLDEICVSKDAALQFQLACLFGWPTVKDTKLDRYFSVQKQEKNVLTLFLMNEPASNFQDSFLPEFAREMSKPDSAIHALFEAAKEGDENKLNTALQSNVLPTQMGPYLRIALRLAATAGHTKLVASLLPLIKAFDYHGHYIVGQIIRAGQKETLRAVLKAYQGYVGQALMVALKANQYEIFCILLDEFDSGLPTTPITDLLVEGYKRNRILYLRRIMDFILKQEAQGMFSGQKQTFTDKILEEFLPASLGLDTFNRSLNEIMDLIPIQHPLMKKLFLAIVKTGCLESLDFYVNYFLTHSNKSEEENFQLLMQYILDGFSSVRTDTQGPGNLNHPIVKYQIDVFLKFSTKLNQASTQNNLPNLSDLERLITNIFSNECELGLHYLLEHPVIKNNEGLKTYCLESAHKIFFQHCEFEFAFSRVADEKELSAKFAEFQQFAIDGTLKLEVVANTGAKKPKDKWHVLSFVSDKFDAQLVHNYRDGRLESYLNYVIKETTPDSYKQCLDLRREVILSKRLASKQTYYLRGLLAAGLKLNLALDGEHVLINGKVCLDNIISFDTQCLIWLALAIDTMSQPSPNPKTIRLALSRASQYEEFLKEISLLIHNCSMPVSIQTFKTLKYYLDQNDPSQKLAFELFEERIDYLQNNSETVCLICRLPGTEPKDAKIESPVKNDGVGLGNSDYRNSIVSI